MDVTYFTKRIIRYISFFLQHKVVDAYHLELDESMSSTLERLCETGEVFEEDDLKFEGDIKRLAAALVSEVFVERDVFFRLMNVLHKKQVMICHGYGRDEYILCGGSDL